MTEATAEASKASRAPRSLRELVLERGVEGLLAYHCQKHLQRLRDMCFIDNEYGEKRSSDVQAISNKVRDLINSDLWRFSKDVRVISISPFPDRHHHVAITWGMTSGLFATTQLVANLYERSRRPEDEDEERVGPRRGGDTEDAED